MADETSRPPDSGELVDTPAGGAGSTPLPPSGVPQPEAFFGHPRGLSTLFFTELWERFSYYGMRALLILFMTAAVAEGGLGFDTATAGAIYGLYTAGVYLLALPGGWVADRILGQRHAVLIGGIIIAAGHFSLAIEGLTTFYLGLVLIVIGTGLLKPNISTMVGELYPEGGARRDAGFSIFYMGINIGAFVAPLVCGFLGERVSWHLGFGAAGIGMTFGVVQYVLGGRFLGDAGLFRDSPEARLAQARNLGFGVLVVALIASVLYFLSAAGTLDLEIYDVASAGGVLIVSLAFLYFLYLLLWGDLETVEKKRVGAIAILFVFSALFWSGFEQAGSSLNLVAERLTDRNIMGWLMPASWLQSTNPLFIIALAPVFAWLWVALGSREPSSPAKFAIGLVLLGTGFAILAWATLSASQGQQISPAWLLVTYFFHTTGELALSPVGLSTVTKLAPQRLVGQMMGIWFMSISLGNLMAGQVAGLFETLEVPALLGAVALTTAGGGVVLAIFIKPIRKLMSGVH